LTASQIPGARLTMMDGGHMLPITQPDAVARFILSED
jgi:pimeloyl-ACP methyl ester carboxylesterase